MTLEQFADLMQGLGYKAEKGERAKVKPADVVVAEEPNPVEDDTPVMDVSGNTPEGLLPDAQEEPAPADVADPVAQLEDKGEAPVSAEPAEPVAETPVPDTPEEELLPGETPDAAIAGPEMEAFYTFTWAPNRGARRGQGKPRREARGNETPRGDKGPRQGRDDRTDDRARGKGGKPKGKGKPGKTDAGKSFEARPPKKEKPIDPDNPFAAALMGLKDKS